MGNFNSFKKDRRGDRGFGGDRRPFGGRNSGGRSNFGGNSRGPKKMFSAVCDGCGNDCEVPFKPSGSQPVYCNNCFKSQKGGDKFSSRKPERSFEKSFGGASRGEQSGGLSQKQLDSLHLKMDKIISLLESGKKAPLIETNAQKEDVVEEKPAKKKKTAAKAEKKVVKKEKKEAKAEKKVAKKAVKKATKKAATKTKKK